MLLVSTDAVFARISGTDTFHLAWMLSLFSLPVCLLMNRHYETKRPMEVLRAEPVALLSIAALFAITQISFLTAVNHTQIANVVAIVAAGPVFVAVGAGIFLGEKTRAQVWLGIGISLLGIALIVLPAIGGGQMFGNGLALFTIVGFSAGLLLLRRHPEMSRYVVFSASSALVLVVLAPWMQPLQQPTSAWLSAAAMGLCFNTAGRIAYANAPRFAPSSEVALFNPVETIAATCWGVLLFSEIPSWQTVAGASIVLVGVFVGTMGRH